ncbi:Na+/H+ antiporter [Actinomycetospora corticicola]|uniref:CPA1 family monovalent cation:H+ antiporter n=1 Tax=Actinomycetospora corticicola TaxID=663602 RepID=A0A7Y9E293_9PSEU|nr:CPA1 family monovalent cation:H+ antiporter [Actinomycetospora corticicola]
MVAVVGGVVGLIVVTALVRSGSRRLGVPDAIALLLIGAAVSWVPFVPRVHIDPELVLVVVLPLLLYGAAFTASLPAFRHHFRAILLLSVVLTLLSTLAVGVVAAALVPGLGLAAACALGAVVAPPDAVAATSVARRTRMPRRVVTLLEGESLFNDAAALTALTVAVTAATSSTSFAGAAGEFVLTSAGGVVAGLVAAVAVGWVRHRVLNPYTDVVVFLIAPFAAYLPADAVGGSGLVAVVVAGLYLGHRATTIMEPGARVVTGSVQTALSWLLEGLVFLVVGLQLHDVVAGIAGYSPTLIASVTVAVVGALVITRVVWLLLSEQVLPAVVRRRQATWSESTLTAWAGMRGAVSLAAVLTIPIALPDGRPFPQRDLIVFVTFVVIAVTLLVQGTTLSALARRLPGARNELNEDARNEALARREAADAGSACLDDLERERPGRSEIVEQLRRRVRNRQISADERLDAVDHGPGPQEADSQAQLEPIRPGDESEQESVRDTYRRYGQAVLSAERARLLALRDSGRLSETSFTRIQRELDLEHAALLVR